MKIKEISLRFAAVVLILAGACVGPSAWSQETKKILLVHSYHPEYPWVASITEGVRAALKNENVELKIFYMDTKRKTSPEWKKESGRLARAMIEEWKPDAVIAADDNAQVYVTQRYAGKKSPFFVFCGVNGYPADYGLPASNVTGIIERPHFTESIEYLREIVPEAQKIAVISDSSPTSVGALDFMRNENVDIEVLNYHLIGSMNAWKKRIAFYNKHADAIFIYMYHTVKEEGSDQSLEPALVMDWTKENATVPTVGFFDFAIKDGVLCGVVESGQEHGFAAARMALDLLNGVDIKTLPVQRAKRGTRLINLQTAQRLGIEIPADVLRSIDEVIE